MGRLVVHGAAVTCSFGQGGPVPLTVLREDATAQGGPIATVADAVPLVNIPSFGVCVSPENPAVNATLESLGVLTPQPCVPVVSGPWEPGSPTVLVAGVPALTDASMCGCVWEGEITIVTAGQVATEVAG
ncbi:DUF4280 domain-containing protein [Kitasatospora nipponensis]|uniref:DUF4280 domain-containing protein n=1 Tax=Kitasatospora nipponensis TaxID=258049 RepID=A0ABN1VKH8_9ACTN